LRLAESTTPDGWTAAWEGDAANNPAVTLTAVPPSEATFTAPDPDETALLTFTATIPEDPTGVAGCDLGALTGTLTVPIQVADVTLDFAPVSDEIHVGVPVSLWDHTAISGIDPASVVSLYAAAKPGDGELPPGVTLSINQDTGVLLVTAGADETPLEITVEVFGTAGSLAEATATVRIRNP
jgi:hypothetical protein